jgi:uncharacterized protein (DUF885 family)
MKAALLAVALLATLPALAAEPARDAALHALFERDFKRGLEEFPERATQLGIDGYDDRLADRSPEAVARRKAQTRAFIAELERFDPAKLSTQDRISREVALYNRRLEAEEDAVYGDLPFGSSDSFTPVSSTGGPHSALVGLAKATRFRTVADYDNYLKRLDSVPRLLEQHIATMRAGMRSGWMPPAEAMTTATAQFAVFTAPDVAATPLWRPFAEFPRDVPAGERARLAQQGREVLTRKVHPAFAALRQFVESEYLPLARKSLGATTLPEGARFYEVRVRRMTTTSMKAEEIHQLGLAEVARIRAEMQKVIDSTGHKGTFAEFVSFVNTDPRFLLQHRRPSASRPTATSPSAPTRSCPSSSPSCRARPTASARWKRTRATMRTTTRARRSTAAAPASSTPTSTTSRTAPRTRWKRCSCTRRSRATTCRSRASRS